MSYRVFAMDTHFYHSLGVYEFDVRCEMLKELGYDATYLTAWNDAAWNDIPRLAHLKTKHGLDVAGVYVTLDLAGGDDHEGNRRILRLVETLEGCDRIEMAIRSKAESPRPSDPSGDEAAAKWLGKLLPIAARRGIRILLYPHMNFWLERIEDAVRLCRAIEHPQLGAVFCGFHWYAVDGTKLPTRLGEAVQWLGSVNLCGTRKIQWGGMPASIEPLDAGELDNFAVLGLLRNVGYAGMIGFQGYSVGGDVYSNLKRSLAAFRDMERRLGAHANWTQLSWA